MEDELMLKESIIGWISVAASLCYCYFIPSRIPKGIYRFISLLPVFYAFAVLPLHFTSVFFTGITAFFFAWLANFRLLLFAFDQGPLSADPPKSSFLLFIVIASFPIKMKQSGVKDFAGTELKPKKLPLNLGTEILLLSVISSVLYDSVGRVHQYIRLACYSSLSFLMLDILITTSNAVAKAVFGLELQPASNEPYLSTSLQDFWGKRWNLLVTNQLRQTVYVPVKSVAAKLLGKNWAPLPAMFASFLVSGLMHEALYYYVTRDRPTWEVTGFFVLQGVCVVMEMCVKWAIGGRWRLPWFVSIPLTVGFIVSTSVWLFFPPLVRSGADMRSVHEISLLTTFLFNKLNLQSLLP